MCAMYPASSLTEFLQLQCYLQIQYLGTKETVNLHCINAHKSDLLCLLPQSCDQFNEMHLCSSLVLLFENTSTHRNTLSLDYLSYHPGHLNLGVFSRKQLESLFCLKTFHLSSERLLHFFSSPSSSWSTSYSTLQDSLWLGWPVKEVLRSFPANLVTGKDNFMIISSLSYTFHGVVSSYIHGVLRKNIYTYSSEFQTMMAPGNSVRNKGRKLTAEVTS